MVPATALDRLDDRHHAATWRPVWVLVAQQLGGATALLIAPDVPPFLFGGGLASTAAVFVTMVLHWRGRTRVRTSRDTDGSLPGAGSS